MSSRRRLVTVVFAALLVSTMSAVLASDPPDSRVNPATGAIETTDSTWSGSDFNVRHVVNAGGGQNLIVTVLTTDAHDDLGPRLAIDSRTGDSWVAWWRDTDTDHVLVRKRLQVSASWTSERLMSVATTGGRHPSIAFDGSKAWLAYESDASGGAHEIVVGVIEDDPAPFGRVVLATTSYSGSPDALVLAETGHLWVSWIDAGSQVGWSRYDAAAATWGAPAFEPYGSDSVAAARSRIRATVLAN